MNLCEYIEKYGLERCARLWDMSPRRVKSYKYRERMPKAADARMMVERSNGELTLEGVFGFSEEAADAPATLPPPPVIIEGGGEFGVGDKRVGIDRRTIEDRRFEPTRRQDRRRYTNGNA